MKPLKLTLASAVLRRVLARHCESRIPRSGEKGAAINCFVTAIDKNAQPYLIVLRIAGNMISCIEWDGSRYATQRDLPLATFQLNDFCITHYYGLSEVRYSGIIDFAISRITMAPYIKIHLFRLFDTFGQHIFNKKKLFTKQRNELLKFLVHQDLDGTTEHEAMDLMTALYSIKWVMHPQGGDAQRRLEFYLDSLVETGELRKVNYKYAITGRALRAIEEYEEQERKHTENVKMQWRMFWLALAIALLTVVQAGLVKLPAVVDLTRNVSAR